AGMAQHLPPLDDDLASRDDGGRPADRLVPVVGVEVRPRLHGRALDAKPPLRVDQHDVGVRPGREGPLGWPEPNSLAGFVAQTPTNWLTEIRPSLTPST